MATEYTVLDCLLEAQACRYLCRPDDDDDNGEDSWLNRAADIAVKLYSNIRTACWCKPIPYRNCDWEAWRGDPELGMKIGYGATDHEAIQDLINQER